MASLPPTGLEIKIHPKRVYVKKDADKRQLQLSHTFVVCLCGLCARVFGQESEEAVVWLTRHDWQHTYAASKDAHTHSGSLTQTQAMFMV